jgi:hypothetical protein
MHVCIQVKIYFDSLAAGHLLDVAMSNIGINLEPGKGYHFPDGAYVEYKGNSINISFTNKAISLRNKGTK